jgi:Amt family ammonium transporter
MAEEAVLNSDFSMNADSHCAGAVMIIPPRSSALFLRWHGAFEEFIEMMMQCFAITGVLDHRLVCLWIQRGLLRTTGMEAGVVNFSSFVGGLRQSASL